MLAYIGVRLTYFLYRSGYAKYLKQRETRKFHAFFVLVWKWKQSIHIVSI